MINMINLHSDPDYQIALTAFLQRGITDCDHTTNSGWNIFKDSHLKIAKNKCPICECPFDNSITRISNNGITTLTPTMDHYRPKNTNFYPLLKCDHKNYLIMCSDCNNVFKNSEFPLHSSTPNRETTLTDTSLFTEKPLITNPIYDDVLDLFILNFKQSITGRKILELTPKYEKADNDYLYEKAIETIKLFKLADCININLANTETCRIDLLSRHFNTFYDFIVELENKDIKKAMEIYKNNKLNEFGFTAFIINKQYRNLIP